MTTTEIKKLAEKFAETNQSRPEPTTTDKCGHVWVESVTSTEHRVIIRVGHMTFGKDHQHPGGKEAGKARRAATRKNYDALKAKISQQWPNGEWSYDNEFSLLHEN